MLENAKIERKRKGKLHDFFLWKVHFDITTFGIEKTQSALTIAAERKKKSNDALIVIYRFLAIQIFILSFLPISLRFTRSIVWTLELLKCLRYFAFTPKYGTHRNVFLAFLCSAYLFFQLLFAAFLFYLAQRYLNAIQKSDKTYKEKQRNKKWENFLWNLNYMIFG